MLTRATKSYFYLFSVFGLCSFSISKQSKFKLTPLRFILSCIYCIVTICIGLTTYLNVIQFHVKSLSYKSDVNRKNDLGYITCYHISYYSLMISSIVNVKRHVNFLNRLNLIDKHICLLIDKNYLKNININHKLAATIATVVLYRISIVFLRNFLPIICRVWLIFPVFTQGLVLFYMTSLTTIQVHQHLCVQRDFKKLLQSNLRTSSSMNYKQFRQILNLIYDCQNNLRIFGKAFNWYLLVIEFNNFALLLNGIFSCMVYYRYVFNWWWMLYVIVKIPIIIIFLDLRCLLDLLACQVKTQFFIFFLYIFNFSRTTD